MDFSTRFTHALLIGIIVLLCKDEMWHPFAYITFAAAWAFYYPKVQSYLLDKQKPEEKKP